jgi:hypothetical protein
LQLWTQAVEKVRLKPTPWLNHGWQVPLYEPDLELVEEYFMRSLTHAHAHGALSWELRTAMSLARLRRDQGRAGKARDLLAEVYSRFSEGFGTAELQMAKQLLDELTARSHREACRQSR